MVLLWTSCWEQASQFLCSPVTCNVLLPSCRCWTSHECWICWGSREWWWCRLFRSTLSSMEFSFSFSKVLDLSNPCHFLRDSARVYRKKIGVVQTCCHRCSPHLMNPRVTISGCHGTVKCESMLQSLHSRIFAGLNSSHVQPQSH